MCDSPRARRSPTSSGGSARTSAPASAVTALLCQVRQAPSCCTACSCVLAAAAPHPRVPARGEMTPSETGCGADSSKAVGIGIIFDAGESGAGPGGDGLVVNGLAPAGPAARSGKILLGDLLCTVDGMDVKGIAAGVRPSRPCPRIAACRLRRCPSDSRMRAEYVQGAAFCEHVDKKVRLCCVAADMSGLILGPPGSRVTLGFQTDTVPSRFYQVPPASGPSPRASCRLCTRPRAIDHKALCLLSSYSVLVASFDPGPVLLRWNCSAKPQANSVEGARFSASCFESPNLRSDDATGRTGGARCADALMMSRAYTLYRASSVDGTESESCDNLYTSCLHANVSILSIPIPSRIEP